MRNPRGSVVPAPNPANSLPGTSHDASVRAHGAARGIRWLRDPLVQFLVIGVALFLVYGALNHGEQPTRQLLPDRAHDRTTSGNCRTRSPRSGSGLPRPSRCEASRRTGSVRKFSTVRH